MTQEAMTTLIEALKGFEGALGDLWAYAMKANYTYVILDAVWITGLLIAGVVLARVLPSLDRHDYNYGEALAVRWVVFGALGIVVCIIFSTGIFRLVAPEMSVINDIAGMVASQ